MSCLPVKKELDQITGLSAAGDADEKLWVEGDTSCASVYVGVGNQITGVVRVNLWSQLFGVRQLVASAFPTNGFRGIAIIVNGLIADSWHVTFQASSPLIELKAGLIASCGCAKFSVFVPPSLLCPLPSTDPDNPTPPAMLSRNPMPLSLRHGLLGVQSSESPPGNTTATLAEGEKLLGGTMWASTAADGIIQISLCGGTRPNVRVPAGGAFALDTLGNLEGAGTIIFSNFLSWFVQTIR